jgi:hypothetical protein
MHRNLARRMYPAGWRRIARELRVDPHDTAAVIAAMTRELAGRMRVSDAILDAWDAQDAAEAEATAKSTRFDPPRSTPTGPHRHRELIAHQADDSVDDRRRRGPRTGD